MGRRPGNGKVRSLVWSASKIRRQQCSTFGPHLRAISGKRATQTPSSETSKTPSVVSCDLEGRACCETRLLARLISCEHLQTFISGAHVTTIPLHACYRLTQRVDKGLVAQTATDMEPTPTIRSIPTAAGSLKRKKRLTDQCHVV